MRIWSIGGIAAQVVFVASWLLAAAWQGSDYSVLGHSISDMYAEGAPAAGFLIVVITACGLVTVGFAVALWWALRAAGWPAAVGCALLALSVAGLGDALTPWEREGCRLADAGCTPAAQVANAGGRLDASLTTGGVLLLVAAAVFLAVAVRRLPAWRRGTLPALGWGAAVLALAVSTGIAAGTGVAGLAERLLAAAAAAGIAGLAWGALRAGKAVADPRPEAVPA